MPISDNLDSIPRFYTYEPTTSPLTFSTVTLSKRKERALTMPLGTVANWVIALVLLVGLVHFW